MVLDPFCGCGTAIAVAERLGRRWIGIDITHLAISLLKSRLQSTFGSKLSEYDVVGVPQDIKSARALALESSHGGRYQFEYWALGLVDARPGNNQRKGADAGVDGYINFFDDNSGKAKTVVVQVKSGHVQRNIVATLKGDMEREKAEMGLLVTLEPPTRPMELEAASAGFYVPEHFPDRSSQACADRDHRGPAERQRTGRAAPRSCGRADVPPRRAASELGGGCTAAAVRGQGFPFGPSMGSGQYGQPRGSLVRSRGCPSTGSGRAGGLYAARSPVHTLREPQDGLRFPSVGTGAHKGAPTGFAPPPRHAGLRRHDGVGVDGRIRVTPARVPLSRDGRFANRPYGPTKPCPSGYRLSPVRRGGGRRADPGDIGWGPAVAGRAIRESPLRPHQALPLWIPAFAGMTGRVGAGRRRWLVLGVPRPLARSYPSRASGRALRFPSA